MKKRILYIMGSIVLIIVVLFITHLIGNSNKNEIKSVVNNYFKCVQSGDLDKGNDYLDSNFNYMDVTFLKSIDTYKKYLSLTTTKIKFVENDNNTGAVCISFTHPSVSGLLSAQSSAIKLYSTDQDLDEAALKFLNDKSLVLETNDIYLTVKKKQNNWEIVTDESFVNAIIYAANGKLTLEKVTENEKKLAERKEYIEKEISLVDFIVEYDEEKKIPIIRNISIKNNGNKDIADLKLAVEFVSDIGNIIERKNVQVIGIMDNPIKSGYSWKMEDDDKFEIKNLQNSVNPQKVNVYISSVELKEPSKNSNTGSLENQYIKEYLDLTNYKVSICSGYSGNVPGLSKVAVKNRGNRNVKQLTVTVYFQDSNNRDIAEDSFMVIGGWFNSGNILKANYSWKMEDDTFYELKNLADEVDISKYRAEITEISFE